MCRCTPISVATMPASVVLPSPGGPAKSRWSTAWPRCGPPRARSQVLLELALADELGERRGRSPASTTSSASLPTPGSRNSSRTPAPSSLSASRSSVGASASAGQLAQRLADLVGAVAEPGQRLAHVTDHRASARRRRRGRAPGTESRLFSSIEQPLGGLAADARHEGERGDVGAGDDVDERRRRVGGEDRHRQRRARRRGWR